MKLTKQVQIYVIFTFSKRWNIQLFEGAHLRAGARAHYHDLKNHRTSPQMEQIITKTIGRCYKVNETRQTLYKALKKIFMKKIQSLKNKHFRGGGKLFYTLTLYLDKIKIRELVRLKEQIWKNIFCFYSIPISFLRKNVWMSEVVGKRYFSVFGGEGGNVM